MDKFSYNLWNFQPIKVFIQKFCEYTLKEALNISAGLYGKILKMLEKLVQKKLIKYSKRFDEILETVRRFLKNFKKILSTFFVYS